MLGGDHANAITSCVDLKISNKLPHWVGSKLTFKIVLNPRRWAWTTQWYKKVYLDNLHWYNITQLSTEKYDLASQKYIHIITKQN